MVPACAASGRGRSLPGRFHRRPVRPVLSGSRPRSVRSVANTRTYRDSIQWAPNMGRGSEDGPQIQGVHISFINRYIIIYIYIHTHIISDFELIVDLYEARQICVCHRFSNVVTGTSAGQSLFGRYSLVRSTFASRFARKTPLLTFTYFLTPSKSMSNTYVLPIGCVFIVLTTKKKRSPQKRLTVANALAALLWTLSTKLGVHRVWPSCDLWGSNAWIKVHTWTFQGASNGDPAIYCNLI